VAQTQQKDSYLQSLRRSLNQEEPSDWLPPLTISVAVLDMNNGMRNIGIRNIRRIIDNFRHVVSPTHSQVEFRIDQFHVRDKNEVPETSYDIYISSGGPGSPFDDEGGPWEKNFFNLVDALIVHNLRHDNKKMFFGICHSFQLLAKRFEVGRISHRVRRNLGVVPILKTEEGKKDVMFEGLQEKFYAFDNRDWQVTDPDFQRIKDLNASVVSLEGSENMEGRAITGIRYSDEIETVQFHPEAEKNGILMRFTDPEEKQHIVEVLGAREYDDLILSLNNPGKLLKTYKTILPGFLRRAFNRLMHYYEMPQLSGMEEARPLG
jgi:homoserine O-succinyltransferase